MGISRSSCRLCMVDDCGGRCAAEDNGSSSRLLKKVSTKEITSLYKIRVDGATYHTRGCWC